MTRVRVDSTGLERLLERVRRRGVAAAADAVAAEARVVVERARARWGVRTGRGRRSLDVTVEVNDGSFEIRVISSDPTVRYQRPSGSAVTYWQLLIDGPLRQLRQRLVDRLTRALADEVRRG